MKRCPECRRDYYDDTLSFCLEDGASLVHGVSVERVPFDEPATAIFSEVPETVTATQPSVSTNEGPDRPAGKVRAALAALGVIVLATLGVGGYLYYGRSGPKQIESIAVMPFVNESGDVNADYLSDGMTETLIRSLSQLPGLNVKSRASVFRYKGKDADSKSIGKELGVQALLNGRVAQRGDQLRVNLELVSVDNENVLWTDHYDRKAGDLVSLQNDIARDVSNNLRLKLTNTDQQKLTKSYTADPEAYRLYLQGRYYWNKRTASEVAKGVPYFKQAVERDPNFALGYVGLADSDEDRERPLKKEYIRHALAIDDGLAEAHASLGYQYMLDYNWAASEKELRRAMELDPKYPQSYQWNGARLMMIGKYDEALAEIERALDLDPMSNGINFYKGVCLGVAGKRDEAIQQFKKIIEMDPTFPWAHSHLSRIYRLSGDLASSVEERAVSLELDGRPELAKGVRESFAEGGWDALQRYAAATNPSESFYWGIVTEQNKDQWIAKLQKQADAGNFWLFLIKTDPSFDLMRSDPRFQTLVHKFDPPQ